MCSILELIIHLQNKIRATTPVARPTYKKQYTTTSNTQFPAMNHQCSFTRPYGILLTSPLNKSNMLFLLYVCLILSVSCHVNVVYFFNIYMDSEFMILISYFFLLLSSMYQELLNGICINQPTSCLSNFILRFWGTRGVFVGPLVE